MSLQFPTLDANLVTLVLSLRYSIQEYRKHGTGEYRRVKLYLGPRAFSLVVCHQWSLLKNKSLLKQIPIFINIS